MMSNLFDEAMDGISATLQSLRVNVYGVVQSLSAWEIRQQFCIVFTLHIPDFCLNSAVAIFRNSPWMGAACFEISQEALQL